MTPRLAIGLILTVGLSIASIVVLTDDEPTTTEFAVADGESIFRTKGCVGCHSGPSQFSQTNVGPNLSDLAETAGTRVGGLSAEEYVRQSLLAPQAFIVPGFEARIEMPTLKLNIQEVEALVDYLLES